MQISRNLSQFPSKILLGTGAIILLLSIVFLIRPAIGQQSRPYVVFVNGYLNCCASEMNDLQNRLMNKMNAEIRYVPYSNFDSNGKSGYTSTDERFLRDGADFINNQLDRSRPLILIGHSFGGDSVLKLLPRINRRIEFVAVIDPVRTSGYRASLKSLKVPSNVDYFFNTWQENVPFPNDFPINGSIPCNAKTCDQDSNNIARNADYSPVEAECRWDEVTCPGFVAPNPFIGRKGRKGHKQVRVSHQDLPRSAYIQKILGDKIQAQLAASPKIDPVPKFPKYVRIHNRKWEKFLALQNAGNRGVAPVGWDLANDPEQLWTIDDAGVGGGYVRIHNRKWEKFLTLQNAGNRGVAPVGWDLANDPEQLWTLDEFQK
jgi:pimeloyl-ACP methyl ester carboxylesterase